MFDWFLTVLSTFAACFSAFAAFSSAKASKEIQKTARNSEFATHHQHAINTLVETLQGIEEPINCMDNFCRKMIYHEWPYEIERYAIQGAGGRNPRPLRHVLSNSYDMLFSYLIRRDRNYTRVCRSLRELIVGPILEYESDEYLRLLKIADCTFHDFEVVLGSPKKTHHIFEADAFKWCFFQLANRVDENDWRKIWNDAWSSEGWLERFTKLHFSNKECLQVFLNSLILEDKKLEHSVFPLYQNAPLFNKYQRLRSNIEVILECDFSFIKHHKKTQNSEEIICFIIYSMTIINLISKVINDIYVLDRTYY